MKFNGNPLQYSWLENPMDRGALWAPVHGSQRVGHDQVTSLSWNLKSCRPSKNILYICKSLEINSHIH